MLFAIIVKEKLPAPVERAKNVFSCDPHYEQHFASRLIHILYKFMLSGIIDIIPCTTRLFKSISMKSVEIHFFTDYLEK
jgi:hypothetical protein